MTDYVSKTSWRGFSINGQSYITDKVTLGGTMQWNAFYEKYPRDTYELPDGAVTSTVWAKMYVMPLLVNARYNFKPEGTFRPYVGLGTGAYYIQQETQVGYVYGFTQELAVRTGTGAWIVLSLWYVRYGITRQGSL